MTNWASPCEKLPDILPGSVVVKLKYKIQTLEGLLATTMILRFILHDVHINVHHNRLQKVKRSLLQHRELTLVTKTLQFGGLGLPRKSPLAIFLLSAGFSSNRPAPAPPPPTLA